MNIDKPITIDLLDTPGAPALSSSSDMPVVETKPDATNQGAPPAVPPAAEEAEGEAEQLEESATSTTENDDQTGQPASDKPRGVGKKIAELVKRSEDAELRAQAEREEKLRILALLEEHRGKKAEPEEKQPTDPEPVRPAKADFPDADAWEQALVDYADKKAAWTARREIQAAQAEEQRKRELQAIEEGQEKARREYNERVQKVKEQFTDYDEVAESPDVQVPIPVAYAIINDPDGPAIQYYLGKHPDEAKKLFDMSPPQQLVALGKIVAKMAAPAPAPEPPKPKPPVSAAPAPIKPLKTGGEGGVSKSLDEMSMEEYAAHRRAQAKQSSMRH